MTFFYFRILALKTNLKIAITSDDFVGWQNCFHRWFTSKKTRWFTRPRDRWNWCSTRKQAITGQDSTQATCGKECTKRPSRRMTSYISILHLDKWCVIYTTVHV